MGLSFAFVTQLNMHMVIGYFGDTAVTGYCSLHVDNMLLDIMLHINLEIFIRDLLTLLHKL